jgi:hypothetical protein
MKPKPRNRDIEAVEYWNSHYPVGTRVRIFPDLPEIDDFHDTETTTEAELLGGHTPVVWVREQRQRWALSHVVPLESPHVWGCESCNWRGQEPTWAEIENEYFEKENVPFCPECSSSLVSRKIIIKALSLQQPWANMMGEKTIETRKWATDYRGPLLIVASKQPDPNFTNVSGPFGKAVAKGLLVDCRRMTREDETAACCRIYPRAVAWVLEDIKPINIPFPVKGQLGLYDVEMEG